MLLELGLVIDYKLMKIMSGGRRHQMRREKREGVKKVCRLLTKSLVHHRLLLFFLTLFIHQWTEGIPVAEREIRKLATIHRTEKAVVRSTALIHVILPLVIGRWSP